MKVLFVNAVGKDASAPVQGPESSDVEIIETKSLENAIDILENEHIDLVHVHLGELNRHNKNVLSYISNHYTTLKILVNVGPAGGGQFTFISKGLYSMPVEELEVSEAFWKEFPGLDQTTE